MKVLFILPVFLSLCFNSFSQDFSAIQAAIPEKYTIDDVIYEKVYLHVDREIYSPRENIWFKVYLTGGINYQLIQGYKNVYIQLVNDSGRIVDDRLVLTSNGVAMGDFAIPYLIEEGQYTIRAFTKYLKHFGEESYFHKKIWISSMKQQQRVNKKYRMDEIDVGFFPESGTLLCNAPNWIAFKAIDTTGRGISLSGKIVNDLGETITTFNTEFLGMGKFTLMPKGGRKYYALLDDFPDYKYELKDIYKEGVVFHFIDKGAEVKFQLSRNFENQGNEELYFIVSHKGTDIFTRIMVLDSFSSVLSLSKSHFPLGISKVTLRDDEGTILAERIIFIQSGNEQKIAIEAENKVYKNRSRVNLTLESLLEPGDTIKGGLSVAVVNRNYMNGKGYNANLQSTLLLDSELKGPIESSALYFVDGKLSSSEKLDMLMIVQGWRSYYWPDIIARLPKNLEDWDDYGLSVAGSVKELYRSAMVRYGKVRVGPFSAELTFLDTVTNGNGRFRFDRLYLRDSSTLMVEAKNERGKKNTEIFLDPIYEPDTMTGISVINEVCMDPQVPLSFYRESFSKLEAERRYAIESGSNWIEEVTIVEEIPLSFAEFFKKENDRMYGYPDHTIKVTDDDMSYANIYDYLEANPVPGVYVEGDNILSRGGGRVMVLVDGIGSLNPASIPMGDIDYIDFLTSGAKKVLFGSSGAAGAVLIYTKVGELSTFERYIKGRVTKVVDGYQWPHEFYHPKYTLENIGTEEPDYRPTLYWEPFVFLENDLADINFFTSDYDSDYIVLVEGISQTGKICSGICEFSVE